MYENDQLPGIEIVATMTHCTAKLSLKQKLVMGTLPGQNGCHGYSGDKQDKRLIFSDPFIMNCQFNRINGASRVILPYTQVSTRRLVRLRL